MLTQVGLMCLQKFDAMSVQASAAPLRGNPQLCLFSGCDCLRSNTVLWCEVSGSGQFFGLGSECSEAVVRILAVWSGVLLE